MKRINITLGFFVLVLALSSLPGTAVPTTLAQSCGPNNCWIEIGSTQLPQTVEVQTPRDSYNAGFQSRLRVFRDGEATGFLELMPAPPRQTGGVNMIFVDGHVRFNRDGTVAGVVLRGRTAEGDPVVVMITPEPSEDCLIYTTIGTDVHATWEVPGRLTVIRR